MKHIQFSQSESHGVAVLLKATAFNKHEVQTNYINPLVSMGVPHDELIAFTLEYDANGKIPVSFAKEYLKELLPTLESIGTKLLYVTDGTYFKVLTGAKKAEPHHGYVLPCSIKNYEHMNVVLGINYQAMIYNPELQAKLTLGLRTIADQVAGNYSALGSGIIHSAQYPVSVSDIAAALDSLHQYPELTADIEAFSLRFNEAGIGTCTFAWDKHNGIAFACDYAPVWLDNGSHDPALKERDYDTVDIAAFHGFKKVNHAVRGLLKNFLRTYKGKITWHNAAYDVKVIIFTLWMADMLDTDGLLSGLDVMTRDFDDTKIIAYLATNTTAGNVLGLKALAHEFAGNWAKDDIKDIRKIPLKELLQYNLVDALSTWYVKDKYLPKMIQDNQLDIYQTLMLPSLQTIIQMELTGMPLCKDKVAATRLKLETIQAGHLKVITESQIIKMLNLVLTTSEWEADFASRQGKAKNPLKIKPKDRDTYPEKQFNPNSGPQLQRLLYEQMCLPVLDYTDTKQPATGAATIEKLIHHTDVPAYKELLAALIGNGQASKILTTFIPAFENAILKGDGVMWLHGNFNLGGTVSGRLSSSEPNLQNIPAKSVYAKYIKECFVGPKGWLFCGADFNSLEDMISALTTKDPNKLKVYTDGFDGHALRAVFYFRDQLQHIDPSDPKSVNTLKSQDHPLRQESKSPTFALTYQGTWHTLVNNLGWDREKAQSVEANYHELYKVSDEYIQGRLEQASKDGFVDVAFGLRVRTPLLKQVVFGSRSMPYEAAAEGRTAGNAMGQSYGLLNNRAANDFMQKVWKSKYRLDIKPVALIHDAIYILIRDDIDVVEWANRELIKSMQWQELPEIQHPTVKLGAALDVFWPSWAHATTLPNNADQATIFKVCHKTRDAMKC